MSSPKSEPARTVTLQANEVTHAATFPVRRIVLDFVLEDIGLTDCHGGRGTVSADAAMGSGIWEAWHA
jgi:hypothetical protein